MHVVVLHPLDVIEREARSLGDLFDAQTQLLTSLPEGGRDPEHLAKLFDPPPSAGARSFHSLDLGLEVVDLVELLHGMKCKNSTRHAWIGLRTLTS